MLKKKVNGDLFPKSSCVNAHALSPLIYKYTLVCSFCTYRPVNFNFKCVIYGHRKNKNHYNLSVSITILAT